MTSNITSNMTVNGTMVNIESYDQFHSDYVVATIQNNISSMYSLMTVACIFSGSLIAQCVMKVIFNINTDKVSVPIDKWTISDFACGVLNLVANLFYMHISPAELTKDTSENALNYFMIFVLVVTWVRFMMLFLLHRIISKTILILKGVFIETLSFLLLFGIYLLIVASIFTVVFRQSKP